MAYRVLIADDEERMRRVLTMVFDEMNDVKVVTTNNCVATFDYLDRYQFHLIITDLKVPEMERLEFLRAIKSKASDIPIIVLTAYGSVVSAIDVMKEGVFDYLTTPFENYILNLAVKRALKMSSLTIENKYLRQALESQYNFGNIIGNSPQVVEVLRLVGEVSKTDSTVLITGESGTGKELIARALHYNSNRAGGPFIVLNCAAIPENLLESELFGYERGAFTSAEKTKKGRFELAASGTFFLDEISEMSAAIQAKMLRVVESKELERLGGTETIKVDVRIICATNKNLEDWVKAGKFREDLYYRISVFPVTLPPLRERREDILLLAKHFVHKYNNEFNKNIHHIPPETEKQLLEYHWPGNVRELKNVIERAVLIATNGTLLPELVAPISSGKKAIVNNVGVSGESDEELDVSSLASVEKQHIQKVLNETSWRRTEAAKILGINRTTLYNKIKEYGISPS